MFHRKNLVLLHLINRYMTSSSEQFLERKYIVGSKFLISVNCSFNVIQIAAGGLNICLYGCVSLLSLECDVFLCVCDINLEYQQKTTYQTSVISDLGDHPFS